MHLFNCNGDISEIFNCWYGVWLGCIVPNILEARIEKKTAFPWIINILCKAYSLFDIMLQQKWKSEWTVLAFTMGVHTRKLSNCRYNCVFLGLVCYFEWTSRLEVYALFPVLDVPSTYIFKKYIYFLCITMGV